MQYRSHKSKAPRVNLGLSDNIFDGSCDLASTLCIVLSGWATAVEPHRLLDLGSELDPLL